MSWAETQYSLNKIKEMLGYAERINILEDDINKLIQVSPIRPENQPIGGLWIKVNDDQTCSEFSIKIDENNTYDVPKKISILPEYIKIDSEGNTLKDFLNNFGGKVLLAVGAKNALSRSIIDNDFKAIEGCKILVRFENKADFINNNGLMLEIYNEEGTKLCSGIVYDNQISASQKTLVPLSLAKINSQNLYEFLYTQEGFILLNHIDIVGATDRLGEVRGGGDVTIDAVGDMYIDGHKETVATEQVKGHVLVSNEFIESDNEYTVPTINLVSEFKGQIEDKVNDLPYEITDTNFISNGDFNRGKIFNTNNLICECWKKENGQPSLYSNSIVLNRGNIISQSILNSDELVGKNLILQISYSGSIKVSFKQNNSVIKEIDDFDIVETLNTVTKNIDVFGILTGEKLVIEIEAKENASLTFVDLRKKNKDNDYNIFHVKQDKVSNDIRCSYFSNVTGEIKTSNEESDNLLINSSFRICRNEITYPILESDQTVIDLWKSVIVNDGNISFEGNKINIAVSGEESSAGIYQYITMPQYYIGKPFVASIKSDNISGNPVVKITVSYYKTDEENEENQRIEISSDIFSMNANSNLGMFNGVIPLETEFCKVSYTVESNNGECMLYSPSFSIGEDFKQNKNASYAEEYNLCARYEKESDGTEVTATSGSGGSAELPPKNVKNLSSIFANQKAEIFWSDPEDTIIGDHVLSKWVGTKLVQKVGSFPENEKDGIVLLDNRERNKYQQSGFKITGLTNGETYYFALFPYNEAGAVNYNEENRQFGTPQNFKKMTVRIDLNNSNPETSVTYADDAENIIPGSHEWDSFFNHYPCLLKNGVEIGKLDRNDFAKFEDGSDATITGELGDVMIAFPKLGLKIETTNNIVSISMTDNPNEEGFKYYGHMNKNGEISDKLYIGAYKGFKDEDGFFRSISNVLPMQNTPQILKNTVENNSENYGLLNFYNLLFLQCMYLLKFKSLNSQSVIGIGYYNSTPLNTGGTNQYGMDSEIISENNSSFKNNTSAMIKCLGIEDLWGGCPTWIAGIKTDTSKNILTCGYDPENMTNYIKQSTLISSSTGGYVNRIAGTTEGGFICNYFGGSQSTYFCDFGEIANYASMAYYGGDGSDRTFTPSKGGIFCFSFTGYNTSSNYIGRLTYYL